MPGPGNQKTSACHDFCHFLEEADRKSITQFCIWAAATSDGENLALLWYHALDEGEKLGVIEGKKLGLEEGIARGMDLGHKEGYLVAKEAFNKLIEAVKTREATNTTVYIDSGTQTNSSTPLATARSPLMTPVQPPSATLMLPSTMPTPLSTTTTTLFSAPNLPQTP
jgi:hypothetical protein